MIKVVLIGSGNVAKHLFDAFSVQKTVEIVQVFSRNQGALKDFGPTVDRTSDFSEIKEADIYIITVSDNSIKPVSEKLTIEKGVVVHTSGSQSIDVLSNHRRNGVFYPLQTISRNRNIDFKNVPFCLEASDDRATRLLKNLAGLISQKIFEVTSEQRKNLHLAAVFVNNFTNHLYYIGHRLCEENHLPFEILNPLIEETAKKLNVLSPYHAQTGPARRNDTATINAHLEQLKEENEKEIYALLSRSIRQTYGKKL